MKNAVKSQIGTANRVDNAPHGIPCYAVTIGNATGATGNVTAFATSTLGIALSDTTGTLSVSRGGTNSTSYTAGSVIFAGTSGTMNITTAGITTPRLLFSGAGGTRVLQDAVTVLSTATATAFSSTGGTLDLNKDTRRLTVSSLDLYGGFVVRDKYGRINNLTYDLNRCRLSDGVLELPPNIRMSTTDPA